MTATYVKQVFKLNISDTNRKVFQKHKAYLLNARLWYNRFCLWQKSKEKIDKCIMNTQTTILYTREED